MIITRECAAAGQCVVRRLARAGLAIMLGVAAAVSATATAPTTGTDCPQVVLSNGVLEVRVYLPDPASGYYRGRRFDWSGMVGQVTRQGHTYLGELKQPHDPTASDHGAGLVEEFGRDAPMGYDEASPGQTFVKIGVGLLRKETSTNYSFGGDYPVVQMAGWKMTRGSDWVCFEQQLTGERGWGYCYTKRIELLPGRPELAIHRTLHNTGIKAIATDHYSHNMFIFDKHPIGSDDHVRFSFTPCGIATNGKARLDGAELTVVTPLTPHRACWTELKGFDSHTANSVRLRNTALNTAVEVTTDLPIARLVVYAEATALCPESFVTLAIPPGEERCWTTMLRFE